MTATVPVTLSGGCVIGRSWIDEEQSRIVTGEGTCRILQLRRRGSSLNAESQACMHFQQQVHLKMLSTDDTFRRVILFLCIFRNAP